LPSEARIAQRFVKKICKFPEIEDYFKRYLLHKTEKILLTNRFVVTRCPRRCIDGSKSTKYCEYKKLLLQTSSNNLK
jgi:hypothetical protein